MSTPAIEVIDVTKRFNDVQAIRGISLSIGEGEFFSLLGPSGCGKTTLLRMIAGFEQPSTGRIVIAGQDMSHVPAHKRPVNMVFQSYALFPHLTVFENVAFGLKVKKQLAKDEIARRVKEALELVRLPELASRYPKELSGGQQQRIAFARAIVNKPLVLLLDEPLSALDPRIRQEMQTELARFKRELGITFVMVTHDQSEAFALSDRIAVFNRGGVEQVDTPERLYHEPASPFVADFIGRTNVIHGKVIAVHGDVVSVEVTPNLVLRARQTGASVTAFSEGAPAAVWIRADSIKLRPGEVSSSEASVGAAAANDGDAFYRNDLPGILLHRSFQGNSVEYQVELGEKLQITAALPIAGRQEDDFLKALDGERRNLNVQIDIDDTKILPLANI